MLILRFFNKYDHGRDTLAGAVRSAGGTENKRSSRCEEMDSVEEQCVDVSRCFRWWKRKQQFQCFGWFLLISLVVCLLFAVLWYVGFDTFQKKDVIFGLAILALFEAVALRYIILWIRLFRLEMDRYWIATVTGKYKLRTPRKQVKGYRITARISSKDVDAKCVKKTYYKVQEGQRVLFFTTGDDVIHCVHLDI